VATKELFPDDLSWGSRWTPMQPWGTITALTRSAGRELSYYQLRDAVFAGNAQCARK